MRRVSLTRFAWLSIAAALPTIALKSAAYFLTGSVGLLSDAIDSFVNLISGVMVLAMLTVAARPVDEDHEYGQSKAEYFSSGAEIHSSDLDDHLSAAEKVSRKLRRSGE